MKLSYLEGSNLASVLMKLERPDSLRSTILRFRQSAMGSSYRGL